MAKIFISYRRADSAAISGRIYDRLVARFGRESVFKDVDNIPLGADFAEYIQSSLRQCAIALVIIGRFWLDDRDANGQRRLESPTDFVRIEIETALRLGLTVIPVLVEGASMPPGAELPEAIRPLALRNATPVRNDPDFARDIERLIESLEAILGPQRPPGLFGRRRNAPTASKSATQLERKPATVPTAPASAHGQPSAMNAPATPDGYAYAQAPAIAGHYAPPSYAPAPYAPVSVAQPVQTSAPSHTKRSRGRLPLIAALAVLLMGGTVGVLSTGLFSHLFGTSVILPPYSFEDQTPGCGAHTTWIHDNTAPETVNCSNHSYSLLRQSFSGGDCSHACEPSSNIAWTSPASARGLANGYTISVTINSLDAHSEASFNVSSPEAIYGLTLEGAAVGASYYAVEAGVGSNTPVACQKPATCANHQMFSASAAHTLTATVTSSKVTLAVDGHLAGSYPASGALTPVSVVLGVSSATTSCQARFSAFSIQSR